MRRIAISMLALAMTATGGTAMSQQDYRYDDNRYGYGAARNDIARVIRVERISGTRTYERQECWNEQTRHYDDGYYRDDSGRLYRRNSSTTGGAVIGAIIGGALGNQVGKGDGRKAATVAGAVIGAKVGSDIARDNQEYQYRDETSGVVRRCRTVYGNYNDNYYGDRRYDAYRVTYRYAGQTYTTMADRHPGRTIRVVVNVRPRDTSIYYGNR